MHREPMTAPHRAVTDPSTPPTDRPAVATPTTGRRPTGTSPAAASRRWVGRSLALPFTVLAAALAGCDGGPTAPGANDAITFSRQITTAELGESLDSGPRRVEIKVAPDGLEARKVELEEPEELNDEEKVESPVTAVEAGGGAGTLTLALGDLRVGFDGTTRFEVEGDDGDGDVSLEQFVERLEAVLAEGRQPFVEAERNPPAEPQAPDDATFFAGKLELEEPDDDRKIEMNVDRDNLELNDAPPPAAWITVLGLRIEIREGVTELEEKEDRPEEGAEFESLVATVDPGANTFTLEDGTVVRVVTGTQIEEDDDEDELGSLQEVADALAAGQPVEAEGEGIVESLDPRTVVASEVEFEVEDEDDAEEADPAGTFQFEDSVTGVDLDAGTFTLESGAVVEMTGETEIDPEGDLLTLEDVAGAVVAGDPVRAEGDATEASAGPPPLWTAVSVKFEVDD